MAATMNAIPQIAPTTTLATIPTGDFFVLLLFDVDDAEAALLDEAGEPCRTGVAAAPDPFPVALMIVVMPFADNVSVNFEQSGS